MNVCLQVDMGSYFSFLSAMEVGLSARASLLEKLLEMAYIKLE